MSDDPTAEALALMLENLQALEADVRAAGIKQQSNGGIYIPKWLASVVASLLTAIIIGLTATVVSLRTDVAVINSNRFSSNDWIAERRELMRNIPPPDVLRRLMDHERRLDRIEGRTP